MVIDDEEQVINTRLLLTTSSVMVIDDEEQVINTRLHLTTSSVMVILVNY